MKIENDGLKAFQELALPEETRIAGWAALVQALGVKGPVRKPAAVSGKHISGSFRDEGLARFRQTVLARRHLRRSP